MREALQRAWLRRGWLARLLLPVALLFGLLVLVRQVLYRAGLLRREQLPVPVVVVGNILAGGTGKTPVVIALVEHLKSRGIAAGVVSRGHGRRATDCREVTDMATADEVGDEPLLIARRCKVPVFVAKRRADAGRALLAAYPGTQVILCDDGLQQYALRRDVEICVFDGRGVGNGWMLPAGPLREKWPRPVDLVLRADQVPGIAGFRVARRLANYAVRADGQRATLESLQERGLTALAGIARPEAFFLMLRERGLLLVRTIALADHHAISAPLPELPEKGAIICTEKDAVKLWRQRPDAWAVPLRLDIEARFWTAFDGLLDAKLSSGHGFQTA